MSVLNEQGPNNPQDPLHYAPRRSSERPEPRLSTIRSTLGETSFDRAFKPESAGAPLSPSALNAQLESAVFESLRRQMDPELVPEPPTFARERSRRSVLAIVGGIAGAVGVAAVTALVFATVIPIHRETSASLDPSLQTELDDGSKPALAQFRSLLVSDEGHQSITHEQSEQLLQQFEQWRRNADSGRPQ